MLSNLIVNAMVATAEAILASGPEAEQEVVERARTQLRMVLSAPSTGARELP